MNNQSHHTLEAVSTYDTILNFLRWVMKRYGLTSVVRVSRTFLHFGPWRCIPKRVIKLLRPVLHSDERDDGEILTQVDLEKIVADLKKNSIHISGTIPEAITYRLRSITDRLPVDHYKLMHYIDEDIRRISEDSSIKRVLRSYFGCEPELLESTLSITGASQDHGLSSQNEFHFDYAGWESLNVFIYLTDVTENSSYHMVVRGSHRNKKIKDLIRKSIPNEEVAKRFSKDIFSIKGVAGTLFFENTEALHKRAYSNERRVLLNLLYASHRSWLSKGRTNIKHIEKRRKLYESQRHK